MSLLLDLHPSSGRGAGLALDATTSLVSSSARRSPSGLTYAVSGFAALGDVLLSPDEPVDEAILQRALRDPAGLSLAIHGAAALVVHDPVARRAVVVNDPFASCYLCIYRDADRTVVGTDFALLRDHLAEQGVQLRKSLRHIASMFATGVGGFASTPYEGVELLSIGTFVTVEDGRVVPRELDLAPLVAAAAASSYDDGLERVRADIGGTFRALSTRSDAAPIAHLTGGADSRLVLSFLQHLGLADRYLYYCSGHPGETDRIVFESLAKHFDLAAASSSGISARRSPTSLEEELTGPLDFSSGLNMSGPTKDWARTDTLILAGGYGETFRSPYGVDPELVRSSSPRERLQFAWRSNLNVGGAPGSSYISDAFVDALSEAADPIVQRGLRAGLSPDAALDLLYVARNRMFVGNITFNHNAFVRRIDPLYSLEGALFALTRPLALRKANVVGFDLTARNSPDLLRLPFDTPRFGAEYRQHRPMPDPLEFQRGDEPLRVVEPLRVPVAEPPVAYRPRPTSAQVLFAQEKKASLRQVVWAETVRARLLDAFESFDASALGDGLDVEVIRGALDRPFPNRVVIRNMTTLYALMQWYAH